MSAANGEATTPQLPKKAPPGLPVGHPWHGKTGKAPLTGPPPKRPPAQAGPPAAPPTALPLPAQEVLLQRLDDCTDRMRCLDDYWEALKRFQDTLQVHENVLRLVCGHDQRELFHTIAAIDALIEGERIRVIRMLREVDDELCRLRREFTFL